jgi:hypothetical protein
MVSVMPTPAGHSLLIPPRSVRCERQHKLEDRYMSEETWKQAYRLHMDGVVVDDGIGRAKDDDA